MTKANAGIICINVRVACDANAASSAANCGGADCGGYASATVRRSTTAMEITMQAQNPMRSQRQEACISIYTTYTTPRQLIALVSRPLHVLTPEPGDVRSMSDMAILRQPFASSSIAFCPSMQVGQETVSLRTDRRIFAG